MESTALNATDAAQNENRIAALTALGQSIWLDFLTRELIRSGKLKQIIERDGVRGMTSNPSIFQKAISSGSDYAEQLSGLINSGKDAADIFEAIAVDDIQGACDAFRPFYDQWDGADGFVSLEVSPASAHDTERTLEEARRLWKAVNRPNLMIKVPGTAEGALAVTRLIAEGINVNITLLFSLASHERVMWAYIDGLEERARNGLPVNRVASVASFFVSRVDTLVDKLLEQKLASADPEQQAQIRSLMGKTAIANAKLAYANFREIFNGTRFSRLKEQGAQVQRPLWASTSTKNPAFRDVIYVEELIGSDTVNTVPSETLTAFADHGTVRRTIGENLDEAKATLDGLSAVGISYDAVTQQLEDEGIDKFADAYRQIIDEVEKKRLDVPDVRH
jgi:transaldolase